MGLAFGLIATLYVGLAVATITVTAGGDSKVPLADLIAVGFGRAGRDATAVLAVALTMGTMNVYTGGSARLAAALAQDGALPRWLGGDAYRSVPRRPLFALAVLGTVLLVALAAGISSAADLIRATAACFIAVYVLALASAVRILRGRIRTAAVVALVLVTVVAVFSRVSCLCGPRQRCSPSASGARRPRDWRLPGSSRFRRAVKTWVRSTAMLAHVRRPGSPTPTTKSHSSPSTAARRGYLCRTRETNSGSGASAAAVEALDATAAGDRARAVGVRGMAVRADLDRDRLGG
jgi:hypothetical protein